MDFTKLNIEFANIQSTVNKYNSLIDKIKTRIKNNLRDINKFETKTKNTKNNVEKESYKLVIISLKEETSFLESLMKDDEKSVSKE